MVSRITQRSMVGPDLDFHLPLNYSNYKRSVSSMVDFISHKLKSKVSVENLASEIDKMVSRMFVGYFKFESLLHIAQCFLQEGFKIVYRIVYAMFKICRGDLSEINLGRLFKECMTID